MQPKSFMLKLGRSDQEVIAEMLAKIKDLENKHNTNKKRTKNKHYD